MRLSCSAYDQRQIDSFMLKYAAYQAVNLKVLHFEFFYLLNDLLNVDELISGSSVIICIAPSII